MLYFKPSSLSSTTKNIDWWLVVGGGGEEGEGEGVYGVKTKISWWTKLLIKARALDKHVNYFWRGL